MMAQAIGWLFYIRRKKGFLVIDDSIIGDRVSSLVIFCGRSTNELTRSKVQVIQVIQVIQVKYKKLL